MFHLQDNVYFERQPDGRIRIVVRESDQADARIIKDTTTNAEAFASVMASMCAFGENRETWEEACRFLERPYPGDDGAYKRSGKASPSCSCAGLPSDSSHREGCKYWEFVLALRRDWPGRNDFRPV